MSQVRVTQLLPAVATCGALPPPQLATASGPVVFGVGQVVVVKLLPALGPDGVQVCTNVPTTLLAPQVVAVKALPITAAMGVQAATPEGPVVAVLQVVVTQALPIVAALGVQVATGTLVERSGWIPKELLRNVPANSVTAKVELRSCSPARIETLSSNRFC